MKKIIFLYLVVQTVFLYANIHQDEFCVVDKCRNVTFELGDIFSDVLDVYPNIILRGEKKYSNMTYKEYEYSGIIFSISAYAETERKAHILKMMVTSKNFITKRGIVVGSNRNDVIKAYGDADRIRGNKFVFLNIEYDHMELIFSFDNFGIVESIELILGT
ncbi:hypothetical protein LJC14_00470 [Treponema sp. OttesenSCG-928-L16]|nr:hypothetical protein [Treponema sp. OttesenSCG-928-L16]